MRSSGQQGRQDGWCCPGRYRQHPGQADPGDGQGGHDGGGVRRVGQDRGSEVARERADLSQSSANHRDLLS